VLDKGSDLLAAGLAQLRDVAIVGGVGAFTRTGSS
jgi:hypothetical protein